MDSPIDKELRAINNGLRIDVQCQESSRPKRLDALPTATLRPEGHCAKTGLRRLNTWAMLVYIAAGGRSPMDFGALCFEPETEDEGKLIDAVQSALKNCGGLKLLPHSGEMASSCVYDECMDDGTFRDL